MLDVQLTDMGEGQSYESDPPSIAPWNELEEWLNRPVLTYSLWLSQQTKLSSTCKVYESMWGKLCGWMSREGISLDALTGADLFRFLDTETFNIRRGRSGAVPVESIKEDEKAEKKEAKEHRQRYVRMVEKVFDHLFELGLSIENPGRKAGKEKAGKGRNAPMRFLTPLERSNLFQVLRQEFSRPIPEEEKEKEKAKWTKVRDACLVAMIVGAGMKVSEVDSLSVNCTSDGFLIIPPKYQRPKRKCPVLPIASEGLSKWTEWVSSLPSLSTSVLFPADVIRRRNDQTQPTEAMHPATMFRRVSALFKAAGIDGSRIGGQTLRNTYAAMLFEEGHSDNEMMEYLGIKLPENMIDMRQQHTAWFAKYG